MHAIGDVTGIPLAMGKPLPMAGVFAEREAAVVAHNIARDITGKGNLRPTTDPVNASSRPVAVRPGSAAATSTQSQRLRSSSPR